LIRQLVRVFGAEQVFSEDGSKVILPGVVIIDEIDVHLHPRWQRTIGPWLTSHFPNLQFLVSTHSPLVCQGAINGTITRLPSPGSDDNGGRVAGEALNRLLYGDILEALGSGAFGENVDRSEFAQELFHELARLNVRARRQPLNEADAARRLDLSRKFAIHPDFLEEVSNA
jgi:AAA domain, putative AbiEii toxin, Type IV TA system